MSGRDSTQREVIDRLSIILHPARATMPAPHEPRSQQRLSSGRALTASPRRDAGVGAIQQRYRLYRVCGYGVVSALYYSTKSPAW
jgi:hypothetical protein